MFNIRWVSRVKVEMFIRVPEMDVIDFFHEKKNEFWLVVFAVEYFIFIM